MFHRYCRNKTITLDKDYVPILDLHESGELDAMIMQVCLVVLIEGSGRFMCS